MIIVLSILHLKGIKPGVLNEVYETGNRDFIVNLFNEKHVKAEQYPLKAVSCMSFCNTSTCLK